MNKTRRTPVEFTNLRRQAIGGKVTTYHCNCRNQIGRRVRSCQRCKDDGFTI